MDSEGTFRYSSQADTLIAKRRAGKLCIPIFIVFGLTGPEIELLSTVSVAHTLSTRPLIGYAIRIVVETTLLLYRVRCKQLLVSLEI